MNESGLTKGSSFAWLNVAQFLGALNDNLFKLLVVYLLVDSFGKDMAATLSITSILFVVPFLLFSHAGGVLADRYSKRTVIVAMKALEVVLMAAGLVAVKLASVPLLYGLIFLMCMQSALFGPSKYGIIPELVPGDRLSKANSYLVGLSYLAIIAGTFLPTFFLVRFTNRSFEGLGVVCVVVAVLGWAASLGISRTPSASRNSRFSIMFIVDTARTLRDIAKDRYLLLTLLGSAYFLFLGAIIQQNVMLYGQESLGMSAIESGSLFPVAALGIGLGALTSGRVSGRNIEFGLVPLGALGLTVCSILLFAVSPLLKSVLALVFLVGVFSGIFTVPLNAFVQARSPVNRRGEILACVNFLSFAGVALSAGVYMLLFMVMGLDARQCFLAIGLLTCVLAVAAIVVLPDFLVRFVMVLITRFLYRIRSTGLNNLPNDGPALLVSNHVTWVDSLLISATQQRRIRYVMAREIYENRWLNPLFRLMQAIPISPDDPPRQIVASLNAARQALSDGYMVCIFAEGAITRNGNLREFKPGLERIVKGTQAQIIPVHIGGAWGSIFSYYSGRLFSRLPRELPYPVWLTFGKPMPSSSSTAEVRRAILELSAMEFDGRKSWRRTLGCQFVKSARKYWSKPALADTSGKRLTFGKTLCGSLIMAGRIKSLLSGQDKVGVLLPACAAGALANTAIVLLGKTPVNLNFTASATALESAIRQCGIKTVISARPFLEKMEALPRPDGLVYIEDLTQRIGAWEKARAWFSAQLVPARMLLGDRSVGPDSLATIIFSSGSTGEPKGVMLSHHNIISNIEAFRQVFKLEPKDRMCGVLPFFHSFGFTATLWCPLLSGFLVCYHPNPLDGAIIADVVRENRVTILLSTPTFLLAYIRKAKREDFASLRQVVVGAEKLKKRVADSFEERFGIRPLEAYGATELSPAVALNLPDVTLDRVRQVGKKEGSVGHPIPGVAAKIVDPESGIVLPEGEEGLLMIKGPNVMMGYLGKPDKTAEVLEDGWYKTGDIARMDKDGFVFLVDRMSRYSKIGGEMVPHLAIEDALLQGLKAVHQVVVVTSAPDERKGEQIVVVYTDDAGTPDEMDGLLKESNLPNLWKPKKENYLRVDRIPSLGSGKLDLKRLREMASEFVESRPGVVKRTVDRIRDALGIPEDSNDK